MQGDGKAWLFAPSGLVDGPLPAHYEPQESPFVNLLYTLQHNPVREIITRIRSARAVRRRCGRWAGAHRHRPIELPDDETGLR